MALPADASGADLAFIDHMATHVTNAYLDDHITN